MILVLKRCIFTQSQQLEENMKGGKEKFACATEQSVNNFKKRITEISLTYIVRRLKKFALSKPRIVIHTRENNQQ